ncbi:MAG TPA: enoyl-CoA hydratase/isomerase family protein [Gordonia sp. (in: high G+C Gram-positive bacteria)]|uniref:enoyl-CoA hydratase/isomerase family protein n=2 Tax=unclassified Gordonia (in: high G+C Gram-positive bacteria) TaxID=2657482 RepID=UPI000FC03566|nr:enoyl-CoA hydratase/isomerase family protein [Gordonia sp. (in: high G+C Gram-positive bacteria)]RTL08388.1 MAG: enoyl-CoA hydratase/isomerase family protein [Acidimicrobiia bacterium]HNP57181.1 enoyl-CoA hydratase/isomerase family protein [Gordonia sp. (in: high G+C Gram-positive bacteria)]HRC50191.1 enoyl-CoA hydratase/isomerase family protein [Gordonia sp. (in: high G+C Gram-positive bacteria)]
MLRIDDDGCVRTLTLDRPEALNAFNEALYDATARGLRDAAADPDVSVVVITGAGRAFSAGTDLMEMQARVSDPDFVPGEFGFPGLVDALAEFPKPLIVAINGIGLGIGATIIGFADLVFMSSQARLKCPFTALGVAPEASSSFFMPALIGRQNATWMLMSSEWIDAAQAQRMGLVFDVCEPDELMPTTYRHAHVLADKPLASLMAVKETMVAPISEQVRAAKEVEGAWFRRLMGTGANAEALADFTGKDG